MWIERIQLENVLALREAGVVLSPGFNVVLSPNEGGKSSLFRSVVAGFFARAGTQSKDVLALARWGCGGRFRIEIDFHLAQASYRLVRDFGSKEHAIFRKDDARPFAKGKDVDAFLAEHLPVPDENLFLRVCGVRHEQLGLVGEEAPSVGGKIEELLGGGWGEVTPAGIERTVEDKRKDLVRGMDRPVREENRGAVKRFTDEVERLERDAGRASVLAGSRERLLKGIAGLDSKLARVDADLTILKTKKERANAFRESEKNEAAHREKADGIRMRLKRVEELRAMKDALVSEGARFAGPLASRTAASLDDMRNDLAREAMLDAEGARAGSARTAAPPVWKPVLASILILAGAAGAIFWKPLALVVVAAGLALTIQYLAGRNDGRGTVPSASRREELERLRGARASWAGHRSLDESRGLLAEYVSWLDRVRDVETRLEEAAGGSARDVGALAAKLDKEYGASAVALRVLIESRAALEPYRTDADGMLRIERELAAQGRERDRLAAERADRDRELAALERIDGTDIAERLACAKDGLMRAERKVRVLDAILGTLGEARREMAGTLSGRLPPLAGRYLSLVTGGRYDTLFIDPLTMKVEIAPAAGDAETGAGAPGPGRIEPDALSQGASDQVHLAVRLALVELMSRGEPQPVFLDDSFVHFDPARRARALDLVREFATKHQVILFTCDPAYRDAGAHLVELPYRA